MLIYYESNVIYKLQKYSELKYSYKNRNRLMEFEHPCGARIVRAPEILAQMFFV